jgi:hypothetical protein
MSILLRDEHLQLAILEPFGVESTYLDWRYHNLSGLHVSSTWIWRLALESPGGCYWTMATNSRPQTIRGSLQNKSHGVRSFIIRRLSGIRMCSEGDEVRWIEKS